MTVFRGILGVILLLGIVWLFSTNRRALPWRLVLGGLLLQVLLACAFLFDTGARALLDPVSDFFVAVARASDEGSRMIFGALMDEESLKKAFGPFSGYVFAFRALPTIIFFSALTSLLYYLGILQRIVFAFAWVMQRLMRLSGAESLAAAGEVFLGQTESALLVKPYLPKMTRSEVMTMMIGGMATIAGGVMAAYISMLGGGDPVQQAEFARFLLCASLMNAPAAIIVAKILMPESEQVNTDLRVPREKCGSNFFDALASGTSEGLSLALNVGAMLISFVAFAWLLNWMLGGIGYYTGLDGWIRQVSGGVFPGLRLETIFGTLMAPLAWLMGAEGSDVLRAGQLLGTKLSLNEFIAYAQLGEWKATGAVSAKTVYLSTFALCGFANIGSVGIQIAGIGGLAPEQRPNLVKLGARALFGGTMATLVTAALAGCFYRG